MIEVSRLTKSFAKRVAVDDLSFTVQAGRVTGFLGPNGSGKSTTMRCMLDLDRPDVGTVRFAGQPFSDFKRPLSEVGAVLDAGYAHPGRSGRNHLRYLAVSNGLPASRVDAVLDLVGLSEVANRRHGTYSLGMKQRLGLAAALLGDPPILLFDEPMNGLDPEGIRWMRQFLRFLSAEGRTVLVSSHLLSEMDQTADDLVVIGQGRLIAADSMATFIAANVRAWVSVSTPQASELAVALGNRGGLVSPDGGGGLRVEGLTAAQVGETAFASGAVLHSLSTQQASLEEAFMQATGSSVEFRGQAFPEAPAPSAPVAGSTWAAPECRS